MVHIGSLMAFAWDDWCTQQFGHFIGDSKKKNYILNLRSSKTARTFFQEN